ncbi:MAG: hypothetical protein ACOX6E_03975 [Syntrophomonadaceae bacterium]|jgi:stage III sporulation protein AB
MLFKTIGIALIVAGFGSWGLSKARDLEYRVNELNNIRLAIGFLEKEVTYTYTPLSRALSRTAIFCGKPTSVLFEESAELLQSREGTTAEEAWRAGIKKLARISALSPGDINLLESISSQIGMSEAGEQKKVFQLLQEELRMHQEKAREDVKSGRKLWSYGGFIIGAVIVLLLI